MTNNEIIEKYNITIAIQDGQEMMRVGHSTPPTTAEITMLKSAKPEIMEELKRREAEKVALESAEAEKIRNNIPGLEELKNIRNSWEIFYDKRSASIENSGFNYPTEPSMKLSVASSKYPVAAAYLKAQSYADASNFNKYSAGKKAVTAIENGEDYTKVIEEMESNWSKAAHASVWNN